MAAVGSCWLAGRSPPSHEGQFIAPPALAEDVDETADPATCDGEREMVAIVQDGGRIDERVLPVLEVAIVGEVRDREGLPEDYASRYVRVPR